MAAIIPDTTKLAPSWIFFNMLTYLPIFFLIFASGLCIGSFLNVVIDRLPNGRGLGGRSKADCCKVTLGVVDLIPVLSYVFHVGRCGHCGQKVSFYYPLVELISAIFTATAFFYFPVPFNLFYLVSFYFLIVFFFTDLKYGLVPVSVFLVNLLFVITFQVYLFSIGQLSIFNFQFSIISAIVAALFFIFLILITRGRGMGFGDVLLAFLFSLIVGFPSSIIMVFLSFIFGGLFSVFLLLSKKKNLGQSLPFGPFMVLATTTSVFYGRQIIDWYFALAFR